jgi:hypothetical protein
MAQEQRLFKGLCRRTGVGDTDLACQALDVTTWPPGHLFGIIHIYKKGGDCDHHFA